MGLLDKVSDVLIGDDTTEEQSIEKRTGAFNVPEWAVKDRVNVEKRTGISAGTMM